MDAITAEGLVKMYRASKSEARRAQSHDLARPEPILVTLAWVLVFIATFAPLGVRRYRSMSS